MVTTRTYLSSAQMLLLVMASCTGCFTADDGEANGSNGVWPRTCAEVDRSQMAAPPEKVGSAENVLSGVYRIDTTFIYDNSEKVVIEPGTIFLMGPDARLVFGWRNDPASVFANGTAERPVLFCGTDARKGHWQDLQILGGTTTDSYLEHVRIEDAGGGPSSDASAALAVVQPVQLRHVAVVGGSGVGAWVGGLGADSEALTVTGHDGVSLVLHGESAINNLPAGNYTGNGEDVAEVREINDTEVVFRDRGIPYRQMDKRVIFGSANGTQTSVTLEAGVTYQFCQDCSMTVGWRNDPGAIYARGTADAPVVFTSSRQDARPGDWDGISLLGGVASDSVIEHTTFRYGGKSGSGNLLIEGGQGSITNSTFSNSSGAGIRIQTSRAPGLSIGDDNTFEDNAEGDIVEVE